ncbi:MAG: ATP-binding protein [Lentisphaerota bacterium]
MQLTLQTYYRIEFLPLIISFVSEVARCLGANSKEISELSMAAEEAATHIIEGFPGDGLDEQFEVRCETLPDGLQLVFSNMGRPVNERALPKYESDRPEETIDGLRFFLIEKLVDQFEFINEGQRGWRTILRKRLTQLALPAPRETDDTAETAPAGEKLAVRQATTEDVGSIVELAYHTYRYSYSKNVFYFADQLRAALTGGQVTSFIAINPAGQVVGQMALLASEEGPGIVEIGAVMVEPRYRRSMGLLHLIKAVRQNTRERSGTLHLAEANLVTTHTLSQKACGLFHFQPMALKLSVHGRARFLKLQEEAATQRESLLYAIFSVNKAPVAPLHIPARHLDISRRLFERAAIPFSVAPASAGALPAATEFSVDSNREEESALLRIHQPGQDLMPLLRAQLFACEADGIKTIAVHLPGWLPIPSSLDEDLRALRLFFSGWVAVTPDKWAILYTRLNAQHFDFKQIQLCDPSALELREYVEACFNETVA